jgi:pimeloyl-ACP methyl ester carboxylesterase
VAEHRVLSIDLSGHGDSDRRETYSLETWADEVLAVARAESAVLDGSGPPIIFGHSMGGFVALTAGRDHGDELAGVVAIDSPVRELSPEVKEWLASGRDVPPNKIHPTREETEARFRTLPKDESSLEYVRRHIAAGSVRELEGGWSWKFDPHIFLRSQMEPEDLATTACPVALVRGERGMATTDITEVVKERLGGHVPVTVVPDAGHHIMLDQPIALIALLQTLLGQWRAT